MKPFDVIIGGKSLYEDFEIIVSEFYVSPPKPVLKILDIPGTSDGIDISEAISGDVEYSYRDIEMETATNCGKDRAYSQYSKLANFLHGRKMDIIHAKDLGFFWNGRVNLDSFEKTFYGGTPRISASVNAYKRESQSSLEPWLWDSFSFLDGIIRDYFNIMVNPTATLVIIGRRKRVCPTFQCTAPMTVTYLGNTYNLSMGLNQVADIFLGEGNHILTFVANPDGMVAVDYRGASL